MANTENLKKYGKILWDTLGKKASCNIIKSQVSNYINNICLKYGITEANASNLSKEATSLVDYLLDKKISNLSIDMSFVQSIIIDRIVPAVIDAADDLEEGHKFIDEIIKAIEIVGPENIDDILGGNESQWIKCISVAKDKLLSRKTASPSMIGCENKPDNITYIQDETDQIYQDYGLPANQDDQQFVDSISKRFDGLSFKTPDDIVKAIDVYVNSAADVAKFVEEQKTKREAIRAHSSIVVSRINAVSDIIKTYLDKTFDERKAIFEKQFQCVDRALETGNIEMLSISLGSINHLAASSPFKALSDLGTVKAMLNNPNAEFDI